MKTALAAASSHGSPNNPPVMQYYLQDYTLNIDIVFKSQYMGNGIQNIEYSIYDG